MASNQRRTDDLRLLKTRGLIYQNVNGTYPAPGAVPAFSDLSGTLGHTSGVTIDNSGNMHVPGTLTANFIQEISGGTYDKINVKTLVGISGEFTNSLTVNPIYFTDASGTHKLYSHDGDLYFGNELLAKTSDLSGIADWSYYPALYDIDTYGQNIINANAITASTINVGTLNVSTIVNNIETSASIDVSNCWVNTGLVVGRSTGANPYQPPITPGYVVDIGGNLLVTGDISGGGAIRGASLLVSGDISGATVHSAYIRATGDISGATVHSASITATGDISGATVHSGSITATGDISGATVHSGSIRATGDISGATVHSASITATGDINSASITTTGNIEADGYIYGSELEAAGVITGASLTTIGAITGASLRTSGDISGGSLTTNGAITGASSILSGSLTVGGLSTLNGGLAALGSISCTSLQVSGTITNPPSGSVSFGSNDLITTGNIGCRNITASGTVSAPTFSFSSINVPGTIVSGTSITSNGPVTATSLDIRATPGGSTVAAISSAGAISGSSLTASGLAILSSPSMSQVASIINDGTLTVSNNSNLNAAGDASTTTFGGPSANKVTIIGGGIVATQNITASGTGSGGSVGNITASGVVSGSSLQATGGTNPLLNTVSAKGGFLMSPRIEGPNVLPEGYCLIRAGVSSDTTNNVTNQNTLDSFFQIDNTAPARRMCGFQWFAQQNTIRIPYATLLGDVNVPTASNRVVFTVANIVYTNSLTPSDETIKENIVDARTDYIDDLAKLRIVNFNYIDDKRIGEPQKQLGFIAQQVETIFPSVVQKTDPNSDIKGICTTALLPMLVSSIQSLKKTVEAQQKQIDALLLLVAGAGQP